MKKLILIILVLGLTAGFAFAQDDGSRGSQWDIYLHVPYIMGIQSDDESFSGALDYAFLVPEVNWHYFLGTDELHLGFGLDLYTVILESIVMPSVAVESDLGPLVLTGRFVGGFYGFFGLINSYDFGKIFFPEVSAAIRLGQKQRFALGTSMKFLIAPEIAGLDNFAFVGTVFGRWTL
ncbi:MAG: hypothetical protein JXA95_07285 [Spirochaetales bacterium]|nr:hypothetical protein [Spirochaetales bacterium]